MQIPKYSEIKDDRAPKKSENQCCSTGSSKLPPIPMAQVVHQNEEIVCCGPKQGPPASPHERPGYTLCNFVSDFQDSAIGPVPRLKTELGPEDLAGSLRVRLGVFRDQYKVSPGLYCVGRPSGDSEVLVTANYKLTFDTLRKNLAGVDAWILVVDTRGVNVWCAAGKRNFSTSEVVRQVKKVQLEKLINHHRLILPQLGAPGVAAHLVKKGCGFQVYWGPIRAADLCEYLGNGLKIGSSMRSQTFNLAERLVLVPVEISLILKFSIIIICSLFLLSGINSNGWSFSEAIRRGIYGAGFYVVGVLAGAVMVPALLPLLPFRSFYLKGIVCGVPVSVFVVGVFLKSLFLLESISLILLSVTVSSYAAMNFTGATPFTSPSGVEKEMRHAIPVQLLLAVVALVCWIWAGVSLNEKI